MALSWNEIKDRALKFSKEWEGTINEEADAKPFLANELQINNFITFTIDEKNNFYSSCMPIIKF